MFFETLPQRISVAGGSFYVQAFIHYIMEVESDGKYKFSERDTRVSA